MGKQEEIAQTTYFCCISCINHSLFPFFARNTNFTCSLLHRGLNLVLVLLTKNLTNQTHQTDMVESNQSRFCLVSRLVYLYHLSPLSPNRKEDWAAAAAVRSSVLLPEMEDFFPISSTSSRAPCTGDAKAARAEAFMEGGGEGDGERPIFGELPVDDLSARAICVSG
jgi:hypothetical protein